MPDNDTHPPGLSTTGKEFLSSRPLSDSVTGSSPVLNTARLANDVLGLSSASSPVLGLLSSSSSYIEPSSPRANSSILQPREDTPFITAASAFPDNQARKPLIVSPAAGPARQLSSMHKQAHDEGEQGRHNHHGSRSNMSISQSPADPPRSPATGSGGASSSGGEEDAHALLLPSSDQKDSSFSKSDGGQHAGIEFLAFHIMGKQGGSCATSNGLLSRFSGDDDEESALLQPQEPNSAADGGGGAGGEDRSGAGPGWHSKGVFWGW